MTEITSRLSTALADRYRIERHLGEGGMATVYLAEDLKHKRKVAVKVLRPELAASIGTERFLREIEIAANLTHPHILPLHDSGEAGGFLYYVMPYIEGEALSDRLREGPLAPDEALKIVDEIASALEYAHEHGVVHRDIKPQNVLLSGGMAVVTDFGIARAVGAAGGERMTQTGLAIGTPAYMSPEQAGGEDVDFRTDIWALGVVLFELLTNASPFAGDNVRAIISSIMTEQPDFERLPSNLPPSIDSIVRRALEKDRARRFDSARAMLDALRLAREEWPVRRDKTGETNRLRGVAIGAGVLVLLIGLFSVLLYQRQRGARWARVTAIPAITDFIEQQRYVDAFRLVRDAEQFLPDDPQLQQLRRTVAQTVTILTTPTGGGVYVRDYLDEEGDWEYLGDTPLQDVYVPAGYLRWEVRKDRYRTTEGAFQAMVADTMRFLLASDTNSDAEMVPIPAGSYQRYSGAPIYMDSYWLDRFEVSNEAFQAFVDAGGYTDSTYWNGLPFGDGGSRLVGTDAVARFQDATGRQGPALWEAGRFPSGTATEPVRGVSWYEAAAYCSFAGKSLPTYHHWFRAAAPGIFSEILLVSNFGGTGPVSSGSLTGLSAFGNYDMAGNVKEWTWNAIGDRRYILGGGWDEPSYQFVMDDARSAFDRSASHGFRCARYDRPVDSALLEPIETSPRRWTAAEPVSDEVFDVFRRLYASDETPHDASIESVDDAHTDWRQELVSFNASYGGERVLARLYIPKSASPPYHAVVYFPGSDALRLRSSDGFALQSYLEFVVKSGRVLVHPLYKGTYERFTGVTEPKTGAQSERHNAWRDQVILWVRDLRQTINYLETRDDIEPDKLAFIGLSLGGRYGPIFTALEDRFAAAVFIAGGFAYAEDLPDEVLPVHFAPRSTVPTIMINGGEDFIRPIETSVQPMFELLGTPRSDKHLAVFPLGHLPPKNDTAREALDWLDRYLGPVGNE